MRQIIERQNKKIDELIHVVYALGSVIAANDKQALNEYNYNEFLKHIDMVRRI